MFRIQTRGTAPPRTFTYIAVWPTACFMPCQLFQSWLRSKFPSALCRSSAPWRTPQKSFCFQWFATSFPFEDEGCKTKVWKGLLKAEQQVVYEWFDRIRCGLSVEAVGQHLPADLRTMEFEDKMTWLLSRWHCLISIVQSPNSLSNGAGAIAIAESTSLQSLVFYSNWCINIWLRST